MCAQASRSGGWERVRACVRACVLWLSAVGQGLRSEIRQSREACTQKIRAQEKRGGKNSDVFLFPSKKRCLNSTAVLQR